MNILILMAGTERVTQGDERYPLFLVEIGGKPLIERLIDSLSSLAGARFVFVVRTRDVKQFRLDSIIRQLAPGAAVVQVERDTAGAACSALLASEFIDSQEPLLIVNSDDWLDIDHASVVRGFAERGLDAGTVVFPSVHPRYSYVRLNEEGLVAEAAEKNPISRNATAGFYWFARGADLVAAVKSSIRKDARVDDRFYVCPSFNELILKHARIGVHAVEASKYHPIKSNRQLTLTERGDAR